MKRLVHAFLLAASVALGGCGASFTLELPPRFLALDEDAQEAMGYALRATTADGVVVAVHKIDNDPRGDLTFWLAAVTLEMRDRRGYALLADEELRAATGQTGRLLRFGHDEEGEAFRYWLAVFVTDDDLYLVEAGGAETVFAPVEGEVEATFHHVRID